MPTDVSAAQRHEEIARCLFNESNDALFLFDPRDHRVLDVNPVALRLTGFSRMQAAGLRVWDLFTSPEPGRLKQLVDAYRISWFYHSREGIYLNRAAREPIPVNVSVSRIHTQPEPMGLVVARDITERRRAEETLDRFFRLAPDLFAILRPEGDAIRFVRANAAWESGLGYSPGELGRRSLLELVPEPEAGALREGLRGLGRGRDLLAFEHGIRHEDGGQRRLSSNFSAAEGLIYAVSRDVTEARRAEALGRAIAEAERASRAKSDFFAAITHEIRTPMAAIHEALDGLGQVGGPPRSAEALAAVRRNADHLLELLGDLLDLARIEAGAFPVHPAPCSPAELVADVVEMMRAWAEARGLELVGQAGPGLPAAVRSDRTRLRQILVNLVSNAIKFTPAGRVVVGVEADGPDVGAAVRFAVEDTGPGLTPEGIARLFTPYQRSTEPDRTAGTGLGLVICQHLARLLGGRMEVDSTPGRGSRFSLVLPVGEGPPADPGPGPEPATAAPMPERFEGRILLADDHPDLRALVRDRLERAGATVVAVGDGSAALGALRGARGPGEEFDVLILDVQMPGRDGLETAREVRAGGSVVPIVALTAYAAADEVEECRRAGCDTHLSKPVDWPHLFRELHRLAGPGRARAPGTA